MATARSPRRFHGLSTPTLALQTDTRAPTSWRAPDPRPDRFAAQRLELRTWHPHDASALLEAVNEDRTSFLPWLSCFKNDYRTVGECHYHIERFQREQKKPDAREYIMGAFDKTGGSIIGGTGFYQLDRESHQAEIGYWLRPSCRGQGLCAEMVRALITWAFLPATPQGEERRRGWGLRRLEIFCAGHNLASRRIPEGLGLRQEYHARAARWMEGIGWDDTFGWSVLVDEWDCNLQSLRDTPSKPSAVRTAPQPA